MVVRRGSHGESGVQLAGSPGGTVDRYVLPVDAQVVLDEAGFLDAAMATAWWVPAGDRLQPAADLCGQTGSFVLLAAEGTGKTFVLDSLRGREPEAVRVNLATLDRSGTRGRLEEAAAGCVPVYLYGLDSAVRQDPAVSGILQECLAESHAVGVLWRLACGPAAWEAELAQAFRSCLMPFRELRLLPLTREAAVAVAAEAIGDPKGFVDAVASARLGRALAASPRRLQAVARHWEETRGVLAASQLDAIRLEIDHLLQEMGTRQSGSVVPQDRRRRLAARLAAMMVFGKAVRFTSDPQSLPGASQGDILHSGCLPSSPEADEPGQKVAPAEYDEVLGTALFDAGAGSGVTFRHQQHAEFLAAEYVSTRPVTRGQLPVLLGMTADGAVPPSLTGVAAWIAVLAPGLAEGFPAANAIALAKAAVEFPSPAFRAAVVDGVLAEAASGNAYPLTGDLRPLVHPGLEAQLADRLSRGVTRPEELWWVSMLAAAGGCRSLAGDLTRLLVGGNWRAWARRAGVRAVTALGDDRDLLRLKDLARLGADCDPVDSVLADVIGALYPRLMATAEALSLLRPQRNAGPVGPYSGFLGQLANQIPAADIPAALSWAAERVPDGPDAFGSLIPRLVRRGWELAASPDVREPLARLTVGLASHLQWRWPEQDDLPWLGQPGMERRELALAVAARLTAGDAYNMLRLGLLGPPDLGWMLRELPNLEHPAQGTIARCVSSLAKNPDATVADLILGMDEAHPAYPYTVDLRESLGMDCLPAQRARRERECEAAKASRRKARRGERSAGLLSALDGAARDPGRWWLVARWLAAPDDEDSPQALFSHDLTTRPGWELLSEPQRQQVLDLGVRFLTLHQPGPSNRAGRAAVPADQADADRQGVCLLTTLASHDHARLTSLSATAWRAWAPVIVGARSRATTDDADALCRLVDLAPSEAKPALVNAALAELDAMQGPCGHPVPYQLYAHLCPLLAPGLAARLTDGAYHGDRGRAVLEMLIRHAPETAAAVCRQIAFTPGAALAADARRGLAELDPGSLVEDLRARRAGAGEVAELAPHVNVSVLTDPHLAVLGSMLLECVPFADDPPLRFGVFTPEPGYNVRRKRDIVLATLADRGQAGFFEELTGRVGPADETIAWYFREARSRAADRSYPGLPPDQLLHLLSRADARLVRHDQDLLDVVIAQLDELQRELADQHLYRFLWDNSPGRRGGRPKSEDTVSDFVRRELQAGLREAFFERELQVAGRGRGIGPRIDIESSVTTATHPVGKAHVIVEAKHVTNKDLMIDMHRQLARRYMLPKRAHCGIYLVYWTDPDQRHAGPTAKRELLEQLKDQATAAADEGLEIRPYLLDISWR